MVPALTLGELAWLVARDDAGRLDRRRVWVDPDLYNGQAPVGWIQVRTAAEATALLDEFTVHELSLPDSPEAEQVIGWLASTPARGAQLRTRRRCGPWLSPRPGGGRAAWSSRIYETTELRRAAGNRDQEDLKTCTPSSA